MIADALEISLSEVYGVATFYSQFSLTPKRTESGFPFALELHAAMLKAQTRCLKKLRNSLELKQANALQTENSA